jgi:membrane-associated HD superfamily phosphohydrolase
MRYCQYCGHPLQERARFCTQCGKEILPLEERVESVSDLEESLSDSEEILQDSQIDHESDSFPMETSEEKETSDSFESESESASSVIALTSAPIVSDSTSNESTSESLSIKEAPAMPDVYEDASMQTPNAKEGETQDDEKRGLLESISTVKAVRITGIIFGVLYVVGLLLTFALRSQISSLSSSYYSSMMGSTASYSSLTSIISYFCYLYYAIMIVGLVFIIMTLYRFYKYRSELLDLALFVGCGLDLFILKDVRPLVRAVMSLSSSGTTSSYYSSLSSLSTLISQAASYHVSLIVAAVIGFLLCIMIIIGILQEKGTFFISHFFDFFGHFSKDN